MGVGMNCVIFHTTQLEALRDFYEGKLKLPTGTFVRENETLPDYSDSYVNYHLDGAMLCFEFEEGRTDIGTVILNVPDLGACRTTLENEGVVILSGNAHFIKIKDPEGRSVIFERQI